jgi:uncharacterized protein
VKVVPRHCRCIAAGRAGTPREIKKRRTNIMSNDRGGSERGFAAMDDEEQRRIASKGGEAVSSDPEHMAEIGRKGGEASGGSREDSGSRGGGNSGGGNRGGGNR